MLPTIFKSHPECTPYDGGIVATLAIACGVPTETLGTVLLLSLVLFVWQKGDTILKTVGVLLLSAVLALYALFRRLRRQLTLAGVATAAARVPTL